MKRFLCIQCGKVKRVRVMPPGVMDVTDPEPHERLGMCRRHQGLPALGGRGPQTNYQPPVKPSRPAPPNRHQRKHYAPAVSLEA